MFFFFFFFCLGVCLVFLFISFLLSYSYVSGGVEKGSPFECGFNPMSMGSFSFSMPFFVISLMFLLFDVEILLICFYPYFSFNSGSLLYYSYYILLLVLFSTLYEWSKGILSWI